MRTENVVVNGEEVTVNRLDEAGELEACQDAVWERYGYDVSDSDYEEYMTRIRVYYRDNYGTGTSEYTVDDAEGGYSLGWSPVQ